MSEQSQTNSDIHCAVYGDATRLPNYGQQFGTLHAQLGMARTMTASVTACTCVSPAYLRCGSSVESTRCSMMTNRRMSRPSAGSPAMISGASSNLHSLRGSTKVAAVHQPQAIHRGPSDA